MLEQSNEWLLNDQTNKHTKSILKTHTLQKTPSYPSTSSLERQRNAQLFLCLQSDHLDHFAILLIHPLRHAADHFAALASPLSPDFLSSRNLGSKIRQLRRINHVGSAIHPTIRSLRLQTSHTLLHSLDIGGHFGDSLLQLGFAQRGIQFFQFYSSIIARNKPFFSIPTSLWSDFSSSSSAVISSSILRSSASSISGNWL